MVFTTRGIPQVYYGDELGMMGDKDAKGDGDIRRDFPGGWEGDVASAFTQAGRTDTQNDFYSFTKKLLNYRKNKEVLHFGKLMQFLPEDNVYVYFRYNEKETVMVVMNNNSEDKEISLDRFAEGIKAHTSGTDILTGEGVDLSGN